MILGTTLQVLPIIRSGLKYSYGLGFWGPMGHDGIWHIALANQSQNPLDIDMPNFSGHKLQNYHPLYNILIANLSQATKIPVSYWIFQIFPVISSLVFLYLSFLLGYQLTGQYRGGIYLLILNTISNSFGWVITLLRGQGLSGESLFWSMQPPSTQLNPPFALSLIGFFFNILLLQRPINLVSGLIITSNLILLPITKVYGGVAAFLYILFYLLLDHRSQRSKITVILATSAILSFLIFKFYNPASVNLIEFRPLSLVNLMIDSPDRIYLPQISSFRQNVSIVNPLDPRLIIVILSSILLFVVGNFSWRTFGLVYSLKHFKDSFHGPSFLTASTLTVIPILFIQKSTTWNIVQFLYYAIFLANISLACYLATSRTYFSKLLTSLVIATSLLALIPTLTNYLGNPSPSALPNEELQALEFLKLQPAGVVLTFPFDPESNKKYTKTPIPLFAYQTNSYVSAFSNHLTFTEDTMNLHNSSYDWAERVNSSTQFFQQTSKFSDRGFLINNQIDYIYLTSDQVKLTNLDINSMSLVKIFENSGAMIYKVNR